MSKKQILNQIANEMLSNPNEYGLIIDDQGTQLLRGAARKMHGYDARTEPKHPTDNHKSAVLYATPDSPAKYLADGGDVLLTPRKGGGINVDKLDPRKAIPKGGVIIKSNDIKQQQEVVKVYYDDKVLNTKEVNDIEATKCGHKLNPTGGMRWQEYQRHLEQKGDSIVTKFEYTKYADGHGQLLSKPVTVPAYYVSNVNLLPGTNDCAYFTTDSGFGRSKLINSRKQELQDKMEALILRWIEVATAREEILSLTPPNAFFYSLTKEEQAVAKGLFINALQHALEIATTDPMYQNFQGILAAGGRDLQQMIQQNPHLPISYIGQSDLAYANKAAEKLGFSPVAMVFAGDAINPVGNLVLTDKGAKAAEENQDRQSVATLEQVLNPDINKLLYDQTKYIPLSQLKTQLHNNSSLLHSQSNNDQHDDNYYGDDYAASGTASATFNKNNPKSTYDTKHHHNDDGNYATARSASPHSKHTTNDGNKEVSSYNIPKHTIDNKSFEKFLNMILDGLLNDETMQPIVLFNNMNKNYELSNEQQEKLRDLLGVDHKHTTHTTDLHVFRQEFIPQLYKLYEMNNKSLAIQHIREHDFTKEEFGILMKWLNHHIQEGDANFSGRQYHFFLDLKNVAQEQLIAGNNEPTVAVQSKHVASASSSASNSKHTNTDDDNDYSLQTTTISRKEKMSEKVFADIVNLLLNDDALQANHNQQVKVFNNINHDYDLSHAQQEILGDLLGVEY